MSNKRLKYVSANKLKKIECDYLLLLGERSNGKSYAVKSLILSECYKTGCEFVYLRRFELDIKDSLCVNYFADTPVNEITNGEYTLVDVFRKGIYFANVDEKTGKVVRGQKIGYCHALSGAEHYKSLSFPKVKYIDFEEFISMDGNFLYQEAESKLFHYVSTIFRHRKGKVFLVGNTLSRIVPYYREWGLSELVKNQKQGEIKYCKVGETTIAVYLTDSLNFNSGMFFGNAAKNITKGMYETKVLPHLPKSYYKYKVLYTFVLQYNEFKFLCELLQDASEPNNITWYVQPKTTELKKRTRWISNTFSLDPYHSTSLRDVTPNERQVIDMLLNDHICYSDNLTGTEFLNVLKYFK